jgi:3-deoxy-D-manno-octulosonic-acid transferase
MQTPKDARRIEALGSRGAEVAGNSKFDEAVEGLEANPAEWRRALGIPEGQPVIVVGSTRGEDEERFVVEAIASLGTESVAVVHAPRHLERVPELERLVRERVGSVSLRSKGGGSRYVILDTYGELSQAYAIADVVVVGGGFGDYGGQNLIQPLAHGKPVLHGPHMQNFAEIARAAVEAGASFCCETPESLARQIARLLEDPVARKASAAAAEELARSGRGAAARYADAIREAAAEVAREE